VRHRRGKGEGELTAKFTSMLARELGDKWQVVSVWPVSGHWLREDVYRIEGILLTPRKSHILMNISWKDRL